MIDKTPPKTFAVSLTWLPLHHLTSLLWKSLTCHNTLGSFTIISLNLEVTSIKASFSALLWSTVLLFAVLAYLVFAKTWSFRWDWKRSFLLEPCDLMNSFTGVHLVYYSIREICFTRDQAGFPTDYWYSLIIFFDWDECTNSCVSWCRWSPIYFGIILKHCQRVSIIGIESSL